MLPSRQQGAYDVVVRVNGAEDEALPGVRQQGADANLPSGGYEVLYEVRAGR